MASNSRQTYLKRLWHKHKQGRKRKALESKHSTPSSAELFAACGEPGKPLK
ncbi:MAG TPA: hypothetical protein VGQ83_29985 [Polyangia bacterium]